MRNLIKFTVALVIVTVGVQMALNAYYTYKLAYTNGVLDGICYVTSHTWDYMPDPDHVCEGRHLTVNGK